MNTATLEEPITAERLRTPTHLATKLRLLPDDHGDQLLRYLREMFQEFSLTDLLEQGEDFSFRQLERGEVYQGTILGPTTAKSANPHRFQILVPVANILNYVTGAYWCTIEVPSRITIVRVLDCLFERTTEAVETAVVEEPVDLVSFVDENPKTILLRQITELADSCRAKNDIERQIGELEEQIIEKEQTLDDLSRQREHQKAVVGALHVQMERAQKCLSKISADEETLEKIKRLVDSV